MSIRNSILDISLLPDTAKTEILDFYQFLFHKYVSNSQSAKSETNLEKKRFSKFLSNRIKVQDFHFYSRDELYDR